MAKAKTDDETQVDVATFASLMSGSPDEVKTLARKGIIPKIRDGKLPLVEGIKMMSAHLRNPELSVVEAALVIDMSQQWVRQLVQQGFITKQPNGKLRKDDIASGYIKWLRDESRRTHKGVSENKVKEARAKEIDLRIAIKQRDLVPLDDAMSAMTSLCGSVRQSIDGLPARITRDLGLRRQIEKEVNEVLIRISSGAEKLGEALAAGSDPVEAVEGADAGSMGEGE